MSDLRYTADRVSPRGALVIALAWTCTTAAAIVAIVATHELTALWAFIGPVAVTGAALQ